jgi:hypothetical protein
MFGQISAEQYLSGGKAGAFARKEPSREQQVA